ncbi:MAG: hypothetical protein IKU37_07145 [Candidatus Gastranaerophilales bacterium]|nr:hypothetical protein [Candidatus Gastranaerophilales bacterium]
MKVNSINQQNSQNFKGVASWIAKSPKVAAGVAGLAGSSVIAQKIVMSGAEATIAPIVDIGVGKALTAASGETDGKTNESSKVQAIRTFSQAVGGTIIGVIIRLACITAMTALCAKLGKNVGTEIGKVLSKGIGIENAYKFQENASKNGKLIGGALATVVMFVTNFIIDVPFINWVNKQTTNVVNNIQKNKSKQPQETEVK